jgi:hypothetical protein
LNGTRTLYEVKAAPTKRAAFYRHLRRQRTLMAGVLVLHGSGFMRKSGESLERYEYDDAIHAWIKKLLLKPRPYPPGSQGKNLQMSLMHYEFNCEARKFRVTKAILIYEDGSREKAKSGRHGHRWQDIPPGEVEGYYGHLCGKRGG